MLTRSRPGQQRHQPLIWVLLLATILSAVLVACSDEGDAEETGPPGTTPITFINNAGKEHRLFVEVADEPAERTKGLSGRTELAENAGMLFIIPVHGVGFWMKDTLIPLSVAFVSTCGEVVHIEDMQPQTLDLHDSTVPYYFGIEANLGWYADNGIAPGSKVELPAEVEQPGC